MFIGHLLIRDGACRAEVLIDQRIPTVIGISVHASQESVKVSHEDCMLELLKMNIIIDLIQHLEIVRTRDEVNAVILKPGGRQYPVQRKHLCQGYSIHICHLIVYLIDDIICVLLSCGVDFF